MNLLDQIIEVKKVEVQKLRAHYRLSNFRDSEFFEKPGKSFQASLSADKVLAVIAEVKKASPSAGVIRNDFDPVKIAHLYEDNGAAAISVLTDKTFFQGDMGYLSSIARFCSRPLLRKDFILDEYQVFESRWAGADAILLIAEILSATQIKELTDAASEAGLEVLLEVHEKDQLQKVSLIQNRIIGINNRNLKDFKVDLKAGLEVKAHLPDNMTTVAESGIKSKKDVATVRQAGINGILVGEHLMRAEDPGIALTELIGWCSDEN